ncbi:sigma 54-interacting transcriptional regulator [Siminovitchia sp. FSL H7-0308]|uniref:Arginine utilization regulatory protein n=1 Tax=Siminovitchia thermophila TaxID=1245522 RepID=A0ABS2RB32_9BACI|nr:sigma 54-interacting transcriptional regulator [Siminovitchia thermophila]MBM7716871.1 arginine utilization regulatory protein [Siminovitchia thermophila]ONK22058.1 sigma-54-dependent Fis family transcriptional regulator [Bacillus sp. VT-16-64]
MLLNLTETKDKEILQAILSTIDEGIHAVDANGVSIFYNHVAAKLDGLEGEDILGKHLLDVFPSLTVETSTLLKVIKTGQPIYNQHQSYYNMRGVLIDTVNTTLPIKVNGDIFGAVEIAKDMTKVKRLSEKLIDLQAKVESGNGQKKAKQHETGAKYRMTDIITKNGRFKLIKEKALKAAATSSPILIYGETGTGKELLVQAIHNASPRKSAPFIAQNCAAIPSSLLESILFGTVKGSYTGAVDRPGLFEIADGGTLFLDEINSMPLDIQAKLLRVLENGLIRRVGGMKEQGVNVRIIAAMNEPAEKCIEEKTLRADLYYRLNVIHLQIPPLRERKEDIPLLVNHFIEKYNFLFGKLVTGLSDEVLSLFSTYSWPGNVREMQHAIESSMNMMDGDIITLEHIPHHIGDNSAMTETPAHIEPLRDALLETETRLINEAMKETGGNIQQAARLLRIPRQTLQYKLTKLNQ